MTGKYFLFKEEITGKEWLDLIRRKSCITHTVGICLFKIACGINRKRWKKRRMKTSGKREECRDKTEQDLD